MAGVISVAIVSFLESTEKKLCYRFIVSLACSMKLIMDSNITGTKKRVNGDIMRPSEKAVSLSDMVFFFIKMTLDKAITTWLVDAEAYGVEIQHDMKSRCSQNWSWFASEKTQLVF